MPLTPFGFLGCQLTGDNSPDAVTSSPVRFARHGAGRDGQKGRTSYTCQLVDARQSIAAHEQIDLRRAGFERGRGIVERRCACAHHADSLASWNTLSRRVQIMIDAYMMSPTEPIFSCDCNSLSKSMARSLETPFRTEAPRLFFRQRHISAPPPPTIAFHKRFLLRKNEPVLARFAGTIYRYSRVAAVSCLLVPDLHEPLPLHPEAKIDHVQSHQEEPVGGSGCRSDP
jgi:hypothetical protein